MLTFYGAKARGPITAENGTIPPDAVWIDALEPTGEEFAILDRGLNRVVPRRADLEEIESSSRLSNEDETITMSLPASLRDATGYPRPSPIGFVVSSARVLTIRFARLPSLETLAKRLSEHKGTFESGIGATLTILELVVDHIADGLERIGGDLDGISREIFAADMISAKARRPHRTNDALRGLLQTVGRSGDFTSKMSETLLGLSRAIPYLATHATSYLTPDHKARLDVLAQDAKSLSDYEEHLAGKTQFLLDTLLGIANIEQNNVFRVLTVVSVVGIPPTFFASMWGMNFKAMPELEWPHGYAMALSVIFLSAVLPAVWFKARGWW